MEDELAVVAEVVMVMVELIVMEAGGVVVVEFDVLTPAVVELLGVA